MPYIKEEARKRLDPDIDKLAWMITVECKEDADAYSGTLNYVITSLIVRSLRNRFGKLKYNLIAVVSGVLSNVSNEFYRRLAAPYEDQKILENGDLNWEGFIPKWKTAEERA